MKSIKTGRTHRYPDENANIRWLPGSSLAKIGWLAVVHLLAAYLKTDPHADGQSQVRQTLTMIAETSEDEAVRTAVQEAMR